MHDREGIVFWGLCGLPGPAHVSATLGAEHGEVHVLTRFLQLILQQASPAPVQQAVCI